MKDFTVLYFLAPQAVRSLFLQKRKKNNVVFVDTILLLSVENVRFFQGKILERESHEMIKLTQESKVWVVNNSEHFKRSDEICI